MAYIERGFNMGGGFEAGWPHNVHHSFYDHHDDPTDQLDNARVNRSGYYKRMEQHRSSPLRLPEASNVTSIEVTDSKEKGISEGGLSEASLPRVPEPHPSWRFYTSYDNGEWKRHMVPVYHSEKDVLNTSPGIGPRSPLRSESAFSFESPTPSYAMESNIRRMRLGRPSVYDSLQNRRRRVSGDYRTHTPRSAETILNSMEYLPAEELKRRYNFDNYHPKRRTEYGERVIYPRVKSDSVSSIESGFKKLSSNVSEAEEVTRSVHPSCLKAATSSSLENSRAEGRPHPQSNSNFKEKIIIPSKYKHPNPPETKPAKSILDIADESKDFPYRERTLRRRTPSPSPRLTKTSNHYAANDEFSLPMGHRHQRSRSRDSRSQDSDREIKVLVVNPSSSNRQHATLSNTSYYANGSNENESGFKVITPSVRSTNKNGIQTQQSTQNQTSNYQNQQQQQHHQQHQQQQNQQLQQQRPFQHQEQQVTQSDYFNHSNQQVAQLPFNRNDDLATRVRENTMATVQQMQDHMMSEMKSACPQAADTLDSMLSGKPMEGATVQSKRMVVEQTNNWQGGKPVEGTITRQAQLYTNDPVNGPQDFVERSTVCQDLSDIPEPTTFIQHPFVNRNVPNNSLAMEASDQNRHLSSVFFTPEPIYGNKAFFQGSSSQGNQASKQQQAYNTSSSNQYSSDFAKSNTFAPERSTKASFQEKIIIPSKYKDQEKTFKNEAFTSKQTGSVSHDDGGSGNFSNYQASTSHNRPDGTDGGMSFQRSSRASSSLQGEPLRQERLGSSSRSNFAFNSVRNNKSSKDWSYDIALKEAV